MDLKKVTVSWSGGKDSALALYKIVSSGNYAVAHLHTVIDEGTRRVGLHGVHEVWIERQAAALGLPLRKIYLPASEDHSAYEKCVSQFYRQCVREGVLQVVFGDIFLDDLRAYREKLLNAGGVTAVFPLWHIPSPVLLHDFINLGFKTMLCAANAALIPRARMGETIGSAFADSLPPGVDCCGENGEFHTFVYDGPLFRNPIAFALAHVVEKQYRYQKRNEDGSCEELVSSFWFQELGGDSR